MLAPALAAFLRYVTNFHSCLNTALVKANSETVGQYLENDREIQIIVPTGATNVCHSLKLGATFDETWCKRGVVGFEILSGFFNAPGVGRIGIARDE